MPDKPAQKEIDDRLFKGASKDIRDLNKAARKELRLKQRAQFKADNGINKP